MEKETGKALLQKDIRHAGKQLRTNRPKPVRLEKKLSLYKVQDNGQGRELPPLTVRDVLRASVKQEDQRPLASFCALIADDARIMPTHISLYISLLNAWELGGAKSPLLVTRHVIMRAAKISARHTYNRAMNALHDYGYITYVPSADPRVGSKVWLGANMQEVPHPAKPAALTNKKEKRR